MIFAVHLNDKMIFQRNEIGNIHSHNMLATEVNSQFVRFQFIPKSVFSLCHKFAVLDCVVLYCSIC